MTKSQMRGYLYEVLISHLLVQNNFKKCKLHDGSIDCGLVSRDGEIQGRGTRHQIDFVGVYTHYIPFVFPLRLLAECKFWKKKVDKSFIRAYIGVHKDISENYLTSEMNNKNRFLDIPIIFSANDFDGEAVKLAWAQGINLVSHSRVPILKDILEFIKIIVDTVPENKYKDLKRFVEGLIEGSVPEKTSFIDIVKDIITKYLNHNEFNRLLTVVRDMEIQTFIFATNEKGILINLVSFDDFPDELFSGTDEVDCSISFDEDSSDENERVFFIKLNKDEQDRKFYFQANNELMKEGFSQLTEEDRINLKMRYFSKLSIIKEINGLSRLITLNVNFETVRDDIIVEKVEKVEGQTPNR